MSSLYGAYKVATLNGAPFSAGATVKFSAAEDGKVRVHAKVANTMDGQLTNEHHTLKGLLMSTRMYGGEERMALEDALAGGFESGMTYTVSDNTVTLKSNAHTIVLTSQ